MFPARRIAAVAGAALALALICVPASLAGVRTTAPGKNVLVYFILGDKNIQYGIYREAAGGGSSELYLTEYVVRGDFATFFVINRGKKRHGFAFLGRKFLLKPGHRARFSKALLVRRSYPYRSTTNRGKAFRGKFAVH